MKLHKTEVTLSTLHTQGCIFTSVNVVRHFQDEDGQPFTEQRTLHGAASRHFLQATPCTLGMQDTALYDLLGTALPQALFEQGKVEGSTVVLDAETHLPIRSARISIYDAGLPLASCKAGERLEWNYTPSAALFISAPGYAGIALPAHEYLSQDVFHLRREEPNDE